MAVRVQLKTFGMAALLKSSGVQAAMHDLAETAAENARAIARADAYVSGAYHDSIRVEDHVTDRATSRIVAGGGDSGVDYAAQVEANDAVLTRCLDVL